MVTDKSAKCESRRLTMYAQVFLRDAASARPPAPLSPLASCGACLTASDGEENGGEQTWSAMVSTLRAKWHAEKTWPPQGV